MQTKASYQSKTVGFNVGSGLLLLANQYLGGLELTGEEVGAFLVILNLILRFITKTPIKLL